MFHMTFLSDETCDLDKYSIRAEVQTKNVLRREQGEDRENTAGGVQIERGRNNRSRSMPGPYTHAGKHTAQDKREWNCRLIEREKQSDNH